MKNFEFDISESHPRLDRFLSSHLTGYTRNRIKQLVKQGYVCIDSHICLEADKHLKPGMHIKLTIPELQKANIIPQDIPLDIIFEDSDVIVINKPSGLVVHPAAGHWTGTLVHALVNHCADTLSGINGVMKPGIVHRLDKDTSGAMVIAKNDQMHQWLSQQFSDKQSSMGCTKVYCCLVWNKPFRLYGTIDEPISRCKLNPMKQTISKQGKSAITHYRCIDTYYNTQKEPIMSLMLVQIVTGRTHQIRLHMAHLGCPIIGDNTYGAQYASKINVLDNDIAQTLKTIQGQALHALVLGFIPLSRMEHTQKHYLKKIFYIATIPQDICCSIALLFGKSCKENLLKQAEKYYMHNEKIDKDEGGES